MTAVTGFDDRNMVNQCLLYRYVMSYEPYNFKGRLTDVPLTVAYGRQMDSLRLELRDWLWDGEFQDTVGATVIDRASGRPHAPYSVFKSASGTSLAVVVANYSVKDEVVVDVRAADGGHAAGDGGHAAGDGGNAGSYRLVDATGWLSAADGVRVPPRSAAVVLGRPLG
jgi:hypothetical protein